MAVALAHTGTITFNQMKARLGMTDGNLGMHVRRLEEVGYVSIRKQVLGRVSRTEYQLTPAGRRALQRYLDALQATIDAARPGLSPR